MGCPCIHLGRRNIEGRLVLVRQVVEPVEQGGAVAIQFKADADLRRSSATLRRIVKLHPCGGGRVSVHNWLAEREKLAGIRPAVLLHGNLRYGNCRRTVRTVSLVKTQDITYRIEVFVAFLSKHGCCRSGQEEREASGFHFGEMTSGFDQTWRGFSSTFGRSYVEANILKINSSGYRYTSTGRQPDGFEDFESPEVPLTGIIV